MSIKSPLLFRGTKNDRYLYGLFDSGANLSAIRKELVEHIDILIPLPEPIRLATANSLDFRIANYKFVCQFFLNDVPLSDEFLVLEDLSEEVIIGAATMQKWRMKLDFEHDTVSVDSKVAKLQIVHLK
ncbi:MAG: retropepsin-like aspartic protease [Flavobacterium sp.]|nr:retropepsin-like aspartic protease [Flavobacterium sp.]